MPQSLLELQGPFSFHGGDTGSTPVRDANTLSIFAISTDMNQMKRFLMERAAPHRTSSGLTANDDNFSQRFSAAGSIYKRAVVKFA